jgi:hypothetical protein
VEYRRGPELAGVAGLSNNGDFVNAVVAAVR